MQPPGTINLNIPDDGYVWLKYGQKNIAKTRKRRHYYKCAMHRETKCQAKRYINFTLESPDDLEIVYSEKHNHSQKALSLRKEEENVESEKNEGKECKTGSDSSALPSGAEKGNCLERMGSGSSVSWIPMEDKPLGSDSLENSGGDMEGIQEKNAEADFDIMDSILEDLPWIDSNFDDADHEKLRSLSSLGTNVTALDTQQETLQTDWLMTLDPSSRSQHPQEAKPQGSGSADAIANFVSTDLTDAKFPFSPNTLSKQGSWSLSEKDALEYGDTQLREDIVFLRSSSLPANAGNNIVSSPGNSSGFQSLGYPGFREIARQSPSALAPLPANRPPSHEISTPVGKFSVFPRDC